MKSSGTQSSSISAASDSGSILEYGDTEGVDSSKGSSSSLADDRTTERLLPNGALELGMANAPLTLTLFTHHACGYCHTFEQEELPRLLGDFVEKGTLKLDIVPLELRKYPQSAMQEKVFICSAAQGKGLDAHRLLFTASVTAPKAETTLAKALKLDAKTFSACLKSPDTEALIKAEQDEAASLNITLVPTFVLDGKTMVGLRSYADLRGSIEEAMTTK